MSEVIEIDGALLAKVAASLHEGAYRFPRDHVAAQILPEHFHDVVQWVARDINLECDWDAALIACTGRCRDRNGKWFIRKPYRPGTELFAGKKRHDGEGNQNE